MNRAVGKRARLPLTLAAIALFAGAATVSGLDRASEVRPGLAPWVPQPFRVNAARALAKQQLTDNRPAVAIVEARRSLERDPADARSLGLYGAGLLVSGQLASARSVFTVSGKMGWREPLTQLYWMSIAFNERNFRVASQRLDAILRQAPDYPGHEQLLAEFEGYPDGRDQLAMRLADNPAWRAPYFAQSYAVSPSSQVLRADVARRLAQDRRVRDCPLVAPLTLSLAAVREFASARLVWQEHCRHPDDGDLLADGGFSRANPVKPATAFDWSWSDDGAIGMILGPVQGWSGQALTIESTSPRETGFAIQTLVLPAGTYAATWRARDASGATSADVGLSVTCDSAKPQNWEKTLRDPRTGQWEARFTVPAGCPAQWLSLRIAPGVKSVTVDDIAVMRR